MRPHDSNSDLHDLTISRRDLQFIYIFSYVVYVDLEEEEKEALNSVQKSYTNKLQERAEDDCGVLIRLSLSDWSEAMMEAMINSS